MTYRMKVSPHPVSGVLTRGRKLGHRDTQEGMTRAKEAGDGLTHLHTEDRQGSLAPGGRGSRQGLLPGVFRECGSVSTSISEFLPPEL